MIFVNSTFYWLNLRFAFSFFLFLHFYDPILLSTTIQLNHVGISLPCTLILILFFLSFLLYYVVDLCYEYIFLLIFYQHFLNNILPFSFVLIHYYLRHDLSVLCVHVPLRLAFSGSLLLQFFDASLFLFDVFVHA